MTPHIATCVAVGKHGVLIEGPPASGKSALALALIDRGAQLIGDDGVMLEVRGAQLVAHPHPQTRGLLEIRNLGLISFPVCLAAPIALVIVLDPSAPRFIDAPQEVERLGVALPCISIWPDPAAPALKVEQALRVYGLCS
ncbi:HPr kinase/phosphorylase [Novosphingobium sp. M1R2S20]|uniref:HPr kinase/phosphorylase n=1 Tax=Novosphingobium rhizovicinum TaxID=3228928 RepID=A0ABV3RFG4_9SPHN